MRETKHRSKSEVQPLNEELAGFDLDAATVEELERRFEMALALPADPANECLCPNLKSCGTYCSTPPPTQ
jgi:hypothetical protein